MVFAVGSSRLRQKRALLSEEDSENNRRVGCRVPPGPLPAPEEGGGLCGQGLFLHTRYTVTVRRNVAHDGNFQCHLGVLLSDRAVLGAAALPMKKAPAQH